MTAYQLTRTAHPGIYRRGAKYVVVVRDDHRRQIKRFADTLAEARNLRAEIQADIVRGEYRPRTSLRLSDYAAEWITTYQGRTSRGFKESTRRDYRSALDRHIVPVLGSKLLAEIEPRDIKQLAVVMSRKGLSAAGVRRAMAPAKAMLATAFEDGLIRSNPSANVRIALPADLVDPAERRRALSSAQVRALVEKTDPEWQLFIRVLAGTGMRIGEAVAIEWGDLDLDRGTLRVRRGNFQGVISSPKSRFGVRTIPLASDLRRDLAERYANRAQDREGSPYVFPTSVGTICRPENISRRIMKPAARAAGIPWASFHTLRHTFASSLFRRGCNIKQVQVVLGHHSPAFTLDRYVHLIPEDLPDVEGLYG